VLGQVPALGQSIVASVADRCRRRRQGFAKSRAMAANSRWRSAPSKVRRTDLSSRARCNGSIRRADSSQTNFRRVCLAVGQSTSMSAAYATLIRPLTDFEESAGKQKIGPMLRVGCSVIGE